MKRFGVIGGCLAIVAAFVAVSATTALAAEPALYECAKVAKVGKKYTGKYTEKKCSKEATTKEKEEGKTNKYELKEGIGKGKAFKGKGETANLEIHDNGGIGCTSSTDTGKFIHPSGPDMAADIVATFKGCEYNSKKCQSAGAASGTIVTDALKGGVGYLEGKGTASPVVGADISAESGEVLASFKCITTGDPAEFDNFIVTGSVIGEVKPVNKFTKEASFIFEEIGLAVQKWKHFEGGLEDVLTPHFCLNSCENPLLNGGDTAESAQETTVVNKGEALMLKA